MSLLHAALGYGRAAMVARFTETVTVGRFKDGTDPATGDPTRVLDGDPSYTGRAQVVYPTLTVSHSTTTSQPVGEQAIVLKLPSGTVVTVGEEAVVYASTVDASLIGAHYKIDGAAQKGQTTAARYPVVELP